MTAVAAESAARETRSAHNRVVAVHEPIEALREQLTMALEIAGAEVSVLLELRDVTRGDIASISFVTGTDSELVELLTGNDARVIVVLADPSTHIATRALVELGAAGVIPRGANSALVAGALIAAEAGLSFTLRGASLNETATGWRDQMRRLFALGPLDIALMRGVLQGTGTPELAHVLGYSE